MKDERYRVVRPKGDVNSWREGQQCQRLDIHHFYGMKPVDFSQVVKISYAERRKRKDVWTRKNGLSPLRRTEVWKENARESDETQEITWLAGQPAITGPTRVQLCRHPGITAEMSRLPRRMSMPVMRSTSRRRAAKVFYRESREQFSNRFS